MPPSVPATARFLDDPQSDLRSLTPAAAEHVIAVVESAVGTLPAPVRSGFSIALCTTPLRRVSDLATAIGLTPRALARTCTRAHLPGPKQWLLLSHTIQLSEALTRNATASFSDLADVLGYPDEFSLSRAVFSTLNCRLRTLRRHHGLSFVVARWVHCHSLASGTFSEWQLA